MKFRITKSGFAAAEVFSIYFFKHDEWYLWTYRYSEIEARQVVREAILDDMPPPIEDVVGEFDSENMP